MAKDGFLTALRSPRDKLLTGCAGKESFESMGRAQSVARAQNKRRRGAHISAFRCPHCQMYHTGSSVASRGRRKRKEMPLPDDDFV